MPAKETIIKADFNKMLANPDFLKRTFEQISVSDENFQKRLLGYGKTIGAGSQAFGNYLLSSPQKGMPALEASLYITGIEATKRMIVDTEHTFQQLPNSDKIKLMEGYLTNQFGIPIKVDSPVNAEKPKLSFTTKSEALVTSVMPQQQNNSPVSAKNSGNTLFKNPVDFFNSRILYEPAFLKFVVERTMSGKPEFAKKLQDTTAPVETAGTAYQDFMASPSLRTTDKQREKMIEGVEAAKQLVVEVQGEINQLSPERKEALVKEYIGATMNNKQEVKPTIITIPLQSTVYPPATNSLINTIYQSAVSGSGGNRLESTNTTNKSALNNTNKTKLSTPKMVLR